MKRTTILSILVVSLVCIICKPGIVDAEPLGTAFTYQGRLIDANKPADGSYDFQFKLFDADSGGNKLGQDVNKPEVNVVDGYFTVELDFGSVFDGNERWLEIGVRLGEQNDPNVYTVLAPRQKLAPTPYALQSKGIYVDNAGNVGIGTTGPNYKLDVNGNVNATAYYGNGANLTGITVNDGTISQIKLKTATGEVSITGENNYSVLPGGEYGFYPQFKSSNDNDAVGAILLGGFSSNIKSSFEPQAFGNMSSYRTTICLSNRSGSTLYVKQRYVTSSGTDYWVFLLIDRQTKKIIDGYSAPDHPAYGNGGNFDKMPHPFAYYDETKHEIMLLDKATCEELKQESEQTGESILTLVNEEYKPAMDKEEKYQPLHSGKYLTENGEQVKQMVRSIPSYIKVRKLEKLTEQDKQRRAIIEQQKMRKIEQDKLKKERDKQSAIGKLKALGLNETEISTLIEK